MADAPGHHSPAPRSPRRPPTPLSSTHPLTVGRPAIREFRPRSPVVGVTGSLQEKGAGASGMTFVDSEVPELLGEPWTRCSHVIGRARVHAGGWGIARRAEDLRTVAPRVSAATMTKPKAE